MAARSRAFRRAVLEVLKNHGPQVPDSFAQRPLGRRAWRSDAAVLWEGRPASRKTTFPRSATPRISATRRSGAETSERKTGEIHEPRPRPLWVVAIAFLLACAVVRGGPADTRPPSSPRSFVPPPPCDGETPCPGGYWVFRPPDCRDGGLSQPPGTVVRFEDETTLQCRCRLTWLRTKPGEPPAVKVTCRWVDVHEAREDD